MFGAFLTSSECFPGGLPDVLTPSLPGSRAVNALGFVTPEPTAAAPQCSEHPACGSAGVGTSWHMHSSSFFLTVPTRASSFSSWVPVQSGSTSSPLLSTSGPICCLYASVQWYLHQKEQRCSPYGCPVELTRAGTGLQGFFFFSTHVKEMWLWTCSHLKLWLWVAGYLVG